jgi:hypothetical protein
MLSVVNTVEISRDQSWSLNSTDQIVLGLLATSLMGWNDGILCIYIYIYVCVCVCVCVCVYIYICMGKEQVSETLKSREQSSRRESYKCCMNSGQLILE